MNRTSLVKWVATPVLRAGLPTVLLLDIESFLDGGTFFDSLPVPGASGMMNRTGESFRAMPWVSRPFDWLASGLRVESPSGYLRSSVSENARLR
jgi:hypothetical protein